jgi:NDP-sugar pyrophosphorylase family protein
MNAMIFAAGLGTRLHPLTQSTPKALVKVQGQPLIWYAINNVVKAGATRVVVNTHHFASQIGDYLKTLSFTGVEILISDESDELLETGGGLLKAAPLFHPGLPILIHNADVLTNCNLNELVDLHTKSNALATLMVENRATSRYFLFDNENRLCGWQNTKTNEQIITSQSQTPLKQLAFDGIQIVDGAILQMLGEVRKFSITNGYLNLADKYPIIGWHQWQGQWFDVGTIEKWETANQQFIMK